MSKQDISPDNYLIHYGVLGMKWGVRKDRNSSSNTHKVKTSRGEELTFKKWKTPALTRGLAKVNKNVRNDIDRTHSFDVVNSKGKKVGNIQTYQKSKEELNLTWGSVKKKYRGNGYMSAMMKFAEQYAKSLGATKITGEVVNNSPDMMHIAEKYGYVKLGQINDQASLDLWGGLTKIEKKVKK